MTLRQVAHRTLDWFIPNAALIERSEIGLARNFVATHLVGPFLIQSIVILIYYSDPRPDFACWTMMVCVTAFWLLPFGLRMTRDLRLMALISVELLCITSLIGTSYYGGVNSPFLPWLVVGLMLGLFYLSDHAWRVIALFAFNIIAVIGANLLHRFPQHLSLQQLSPISWFSVFSATAYMSVTAIYYARIITMQSKLERQTAHHRVLAQRLRKARQLADTASHGKSVFLEKMRRQFEEPLINVSISCKRLTERLSSDPETSAWTAEIERIDAAGQRLLRLVHETVDLRRGGATTDSADELALDDFVDRVASDARAAVDATGHVLLVDKPHRMGKVRLDSRRLRQALSNFLIKVAAAAVPGDVHLLVHRHSDLGGEWVEFQIRTPRLRQAALSSRGRGAGNIEASVSKWQNSPELETSQMQLAVMGGSLALSHDTYGGMSYTVELPLLSITDLEVAA